MKKKILLLLGVVVIIGVIFIMFVNQHNNVAVPPVSVVSTNIRELVNIDNMVKEGIDFSKTYTYLKNNYSVSFELITGDESHQSRNPNFNIFVNKKLAGETGGYLLSTSFSPNSKYFAFRTMYFCGAGCRSFTMNAVDLVNPKVFEIFYPIKKADFKGDTSQYEDKVAAPFIESYSFNGDNLEIVSYFTGIDKNDGKTYRISPKQVWNYDLVNNQYKLLDNLN